MFSRFQLGEGGDNGDKLMIVMYIVVVKVSTKIRVVIGVVI